MLSRALHGGVTALVSACAVLAIACNPTVNRPDSSIFPDDAATAQPPLPPVVDPLPLAVPYAVATLRGRAPDGRRIVVEGGPNPAATTVLPDGAFCVDIPLDVMRDYVFSARTINELGLESIDATEVGTRYDATAPAIPGAALCDGSDPAGCMGSAEICDNGRDDDCDGRRDGSDPDCSECPDDALEPNDTPSAPLVATGRHDDLVLCTDNQDFYGAQVPAGEQLNVQILFYHATGDLNLEVYAPDGTTLLGESRSTDDDESVTITASQTGKHIVRVFGAEGAQNTYVMTLRVITP